MRESRLILIEDSPVLHADLDQALQTLGFPVIDCLDGSYESIEYVQRDVPDLVLVNVTLPVSHTAVEVGLALQRSGIPVVFVVGAAALDLLERHNVRDPFSIFQWPTTTDKLGTHLEMVIEKERLVRQTKESNQYRQSSQHFRRLFEDAPIPLWEEDFSAVKEHLDELKANGITDLHAYFTLHPQALEDCRSRIHIIDVNRATLRLYHAHNTTELLSNLHTVFSHPGSSQILNEFIAISEGKTYYEGESVNCDLRGNQIDVQVNWSTPPGADKNYANLVVATMDITARKRREKILKAKASITTALRNANTRREMNSAIISNLEEQLRTGSAALVLHESFINAISVELASGEWAAATGRLFDAAGTLTNMMLRSGSPFSSKDISTETLFGLHDLVNKDLCVAGVALSAQKKVIGTLWVARAVPFSSGELELLNAIAEIVANSVHQMTLHDQTQRYSEQVATIGAIGRILSTTLDLPSIYKQIANGIIDLLPDLAGVYISTYDPVHRQISFEYGVQDGEKLDMTKFAPIPLDSSGVGSQGEVIRTQQPLIVNDLQDRRKQTQTAILSETAASTTQSGIYVPMLSNDNILGVLYVQSHRAHRFSQADAELLTLFGNTSAIAIQNARLFASTQLRIKRLTALHAVDSALSSTLDIRMALNTMLNQLTSLLQLDAADILLLDSTTQTLEYAAGRGFRSPAFSIARLSLGEGPAGRAALENRSCPMERTVNCTFDDPRAADIQAENFNGYSVVPLVTKGQVKGVLEVFHRHYAETDMEWLEFLETLASQVAVALDNSILVSQLQRTNLELTLAYDRTLEGWSRALVLRDKITEDHTRRVAEMSVRLAKAMGLSEAEIVQIRRGALLHDIGKLGIPDRVLQKTGPLNLEERTLMQRHPEYANEMLQNISFLAPARVIPYCHHEKWDGSGYPRGLKGEEIPLAARIFSVIDVWDALSSARPYREAWSPEKVNDYIRQNAGTHFDPRVVEVFLKIIA